MARGLSIRGKGSIVAAITVVLVVLAYGSAGVAAANPWLENRFLNMAHQGGENEAPSNTMYAFRSAVRERGADMLELDVHLTRDGHLVVLHDDTVNRTTEETRSRDSGFSQVRDLTLEQIQALDAAYTFRQTPPHYTKSCEFPESDFVFRGVRTGDVRPPEGYTRKDFRIPRLKEVLDAFPDVPINIEIKMPKSQNPTNPYPAGCTGLCDDLDLTSPTTRALAKLLNKKRYASRDLIVVSFAQEPIEEFHALAPHVDLAASEPALVGWALFDQPLEPDAVAFQVPPFFAGIDAPAFLLNNKRAHEQGYAVHVWTNGPADETRESYGRLIELGVDGIISSHPGRLHEFLCANGIPRPDGSHRCGAPERLPPGE
jgi:glycerophosphoryl diester phosphodiesterase